MTLVKVNNNVPRPFTSLVDELFNELPVFGKGWNGEAFPPVNINETADAYHVELSAPGRNKEDFKVNIENGLLTISYEKKEETKTEEFKSVRREFSYRSFKRSFSIDDKVDAEGWLKIHQAAHELGMHTNATMLYGHIEKYYHRVDHMRRLRDLQDKTNGFNTFIPLKFRNKNNDMSNVAESSIVEDMKMYAVARIYLDNFPHLKSYWPMLGRQSAQLSLSFGVNDIDGTIDDPTKIYSMAGSEEQNPSMTTEEIVTLIRQVKRVPVERDTLYNVVKMYSAESANEKFDVSLN